MYDPKAPSSVLAIAGLHKPGTFGILRRMAMRKARHEQGADDFVSHSLIRVLDPDDMPWLPVIRVRGPERGRGVPRLGWPSPARPMATDADSPRPSRQFSWSSARSR